MTGLPAEARITGVSWAPDGKRIAFVVNSEDKLSLWYAELKNGKAVRVTPEDMALNGVYGRPYSWLADSKSFVARTVPAGPRRRRPPNRVAPAGPVIQENLGKKAPARTLQDLLQNPYDESLFEYYTTSQLVLLDLKGKASRPRRAGHLPGREPSPDGKYLLVQMVQHPYSYSLQEDDFPKRVEVWNLKGELVYLVADLPLQDQVPISFGSVATGRRSFTWRADAAAELCWVEALDGGDGGVEAEERDRVFTLDAPFDGEPEALMTLGQRYGGITWGNGDLAFVVQLVVDRPAT